MKITRRQFNELIQYIAKGVLKEYASMADDQSNDSQSPDDNVKPMDAMTAAEKSKAQRQAKLAHTKQIQQAQRKLDGDKAQDDYFKKQREVNRVSMHKQEQDIQKMKGARVSGPVSFPISSSPSGY